MALFQNKLLITPGISWVNYDKVGNFLYPGVDVGFNFNDHHKVYANVARVNRIPTFTDLYYSSRTELGNPSLKAESAISSEVGYQFRISQITAKVSGFMKNSHDAIDWVKNHPYQTVFLPQLPSKHPDRKQALKEAEAKLDARLVEQDRYFANPENKAKWEKERQDNLVNQRFCW